ncbi:hypothetical protein REH65_32355 [Saccharopolyspora sp. ID03-671]|uniref:hypothetical protein n=1 Tax=Saccharopolyspora sp. ID03-671 TaxID=3073066 RepID=UPI0032569C50
MLPNVVLQRRGPDTTHVLYGAHLVGRLTEHPDHNRVQVMFSTPTGQRFRLPDCHTVSSGTAAVVVAALSYHYRPHEVALGRTDNGFELWCPTCRGLPNPPTLFYATKQSALEHAKTDHAHACGHPAIFADQPRPLPPDVAPDNAVPTDESSTP